MTPSKQLFHELVKTAPFQPATNYWRAVELDAVQQLGLPPGRGLDLGCGDGKLTAVLMDALAPAPGTISLVGVDPDPAETELAEASGVYQKVLTCMGDSIPEPGESFDFVFSNSVLEHIDNIQDVVAEVGRLLKTGGHFIFTVPADGFHACLAGPLVGQKDDAYLGDVDRRCAHLRYWSNEDWSRELAKTGMRIVESRGYLDDKQTQRWEALSNMTGGLLYRFFGKQLRPIEIQRNLKMRTTHLSAIGRIALGISPIATIGRSPDSATASSQHACLLIKAVKV